MKKCSKCGCIKPFKAFCKDIRNPDDHTGSCIICFNAYVRKWRASLRLEVLQKYSKGKRPNCACCHTQVLEFLCIDHIEGGGAAHRRKIEKKWGTIYRWLKSENFPKGFRVLCHNCNQSLGAYGYCPHDSK